MRRELKELGFERFELPEGLEALDWGRQGRTWALVVPGTREAMETALERFRDFVNGQYKVPRPLRIVAPHMLVVGVIEGPEPELEDWVHGHATSTFLGGEIFHALLIEPRMKRVVVRIEGGKVGAMRHLMFRPDQFGARLLG